ncbi:hypothetical protein AYO38_07875 [bacterium SCGC AG-212-C10]|nr:hypothetical protein AYO38_07875 [bacterium SCGC AG-212-C10]
MSAMTTATNRSRVENQIHQIARLRGGGPNPFDYAQWDDRTEEILVAVCGAESPEVARYREAAGKRGRLPGVRGQAENMTLNIHGDWGILARLKRAEAVLTDIASRLQ